MLVATLFTLLRLVAPLFALASCKKFWLDGGMPNITSGVCLEHSTPSTSSESSLAGVSWDFLTVTPITLMAPLAVLGSEMVCDVLRNLNSERKTNHLPGLAGLERIAAAGEASLVITVLEIGRIAGHWSRGGIRGVIANFGKRFDWHCGRIEGAAENENKRAFWKVMAHIVAVGLLCFVVGG